MSIRIENVNKSFGKHLILKNISLEIKDGNFVSFLAPTGSGKTTLLRIMAGLERPDKGHGKIFYDDVDVTDVPVRERNISMVYQDFINYPSMTVYENIASPLRVSKNKMSKKEIDEKVREAADLLSLSDLFKHYPSETSGGQQQRIAIARALVKGTKYIFLDEPLANLDYKLREELRGQLKETFSSNKKGIIIYATADPIDALILSSHVGFLHEGKILQYDILDKAYNYPQYLEVASYFSNPAMNFLEAKLVEEDNNYFLEVTEKLKVKVDKFKEKLDKREYLLGIRAQAISPHRQRQNDIIIKGMVELVEVVGSDTELHFKYKNFQLLSLSQKIESFKIGNLVDIFIDPSRFYVFDKDTRRLVYRMAGEE
ncbi:MAG: ABC transporter ATP-binding protein [Candidatus Caldatribacteriota bacterium]|nr:ABC transporter ATP-binding protein [Candidatus Caldatribacteriota bacterium]